MIYSTHCPRCGQLTQLSWLSFNDGLESGDIIATPTGHANGVRVCGDCVNDFGIEFGDNNYQYNLR